MLDERGQARLHGGLGVWRPLLIWISVELQPRGPEEGIS